MALRLARLPCRRALRLGMRVASWAALGATALVLAGALIGPWTGRYRTVSVLTGSMGSSMPAGSMAIVVPVRPADLAVGDVITFEAPVDGTPVVTHRIVAIREPGPHPVVQTKGDANVAPDPWMARLDGGTAWRRVAVIPQAGRLVQILRSPQFHFLSIAVAPLFLLVGWFMAIWTPRPSPAPAIPT